MTRRGRLIDGMGQALLLWSAALLIVYLVPGPVVTSVCLVGGLLACVVLGRLHQLRSRPDSAVGAFLGSVVWPLLTGAVIIAVDILATSLSAVE
nr:hypothetical protein [uncultured Actinoplanes sp.]